MQGGSLLHGYTDVTGMHFNAVDVNDKVLTNTQCYDLPSPNSATLANVSLEIVVPSPSWPYSFDPVAQTLPSVFITML